MGLGQSILLGFKVLGDWHVIFITILMIVFITLANYVINYKKKPRVPKVKETAAAAPAEKKEEAAEEESGGDKE